MVNTFGRPVPTKPGANKALAKKPVVPNAQPIATKTNTEVLSLQAQDDALNALFSELGL